MHPNTADHRNPPTHHLTEPELRRTLNATITATATATELPHSDPQLAARPSTMLTELT
jgi:hypothetical protein